MPLLEIDDLHLEFRTSRGTLRALNGISFRVERVSTMLPQLQTIRLASYFGWMPSFMVWRG